MPPLIHNPQSGRGTNVLAQKRMQLAGQDKWVDKQLNLQLKIQLITEGQNRNVLGDTSLA